MFARALGLVALVVMCTAMLAGPVRCVTGLTMSPASWAALAIALGVALVASRAQWNLGKRVGWVALFTLIGVVALFGDRFGPLVGWKGSDGGVHLNYRNAFVLDDPKVYAGFVSAYGFSWLYDWAFHTDATRSFAAIALLSAACAGGAIGWSVTHATSRGWAALWGVLLACTVALPLVGYYQLDGFYAQIWILLPLCAVWLIDRSGLSRWRRAALYVVACFTVRFAYGLALGDLGAVCVALMIAEALDAPEEERTAWRVACVVTICGVSFAERRFLRELAALIPKFGWFIPHWFKYVVIGSSLATVGALVVVRTQRALGRFLLVPLTIVVANTTALVYFRLRYGNGHYYVYKYGFHALVLLCAVAAPLLAEGFARRAQRLARVGAIVMLVGFAFIVRGLAPMELALLQRWVYVPSPAYYKPQMTIRPLVDREAVRRIRDRLRREHAEFGGYAVSWGPAFEFVNALFWRYDGGYFHYRGFDRRPNHCVFWSHSEGEPRGMWSMLRWLHIEIMSLDREPRVSCSSYLLAGTKLTSDLCSVCFPPLPQDESQADR